MSTKKTTTKKTSKPQAKAAKKVPAKKPEPQAAETKIETTADALRMVALRLENALEEGHRSNHIDANDLLETLLAVADQLDPPTPESE